MNRETGETWEDLYLKGETPWDKGAPSPGLVAYLEENEVAGRVLVPGCGLGHDVRALAAHGADVEGLDLSPTAVERADKVEKAVAERYRLGDLFALEEELAGAFDWVWEHTCFCAIDPERRREYVRAVKEVLKEGGRLLGVFYLDPYDDEHEPRGGPPHGCTLDEIDSLFGADFEILESWVPEKAYEGREGRERMVLMVKR